LVIALAFGGCARAAATVGPNGYPSNTPVAVHDSGIDFIHDSSTNSTCWLWHGFNDGNSCLRDSTFESAGSYNLGYVYSQLGSTDLWYLHDEYNHVSCWTNGHYGQAIVCLPDSYLSPTSGQGAIDSTRVGSAYFYRIHDNTRNVNCWSNYESFKYMDCQPA